jgi:3',5'-nucleoside bisphosphate phosphatase
LDSNRQGGIDLHIHSTASDGTCSPAEIMQLAAHLGLEAISITDHDTTAGSLQALACQRPATLEFITGVEISAQPPVGCSVGGSLHILGYGIDPGFEPLVKALDQLQQTRHTRTHEIVQRLNHMGIPLTVAQVMAEVDQSAAGRPHVATALIKMGVVANVNEAFDRFIGQGGPAFVGKKRLPCAQTFELITSAGGMPVLAHPYLVKCQTPSQLDDLIGRLCTLGLVGLEVYYPNHPPDSVTRYLGLARKYNLLVTGGTDFHGQLIPEIKMGRGHGDLYIPYALFDQLRSAHVQSQQR